jgi:hypothetical protein
VLNHLLKFTLFSTILLWLKPRWRGLLALTVFVILVHVIHAEYLGYVELSEDQQYLVASYFLKWLGLIFALVVYYIFAVAGLRVSGMSAAGNTGKAATVDERTISSNKDQDDGFDFLREKKELEGKADKLLDSSRRDDSRA